MSGKKTLKVKILNTLTKFVPWTNCPNCEVEVEYKFSTDVYQTDIYQCPKCKSIYTEGKLREKRIRRKE
jgi:Zn-finger nucleic acid-binding protein